MARSIPTSIASLVLLALLSAPVWAVQPSELLLPSTTKGYISTHDVDEVRAKFNETQLGEMFRDPAMQPFIDDLKRQIRERFERSGKKLGITLDDLNGVYAGEVAMALVQPDPKDKNSHATVLIVDVTGKKAQVDAMLQKIDANQRARRAVRDAVPAGNVRMTRYTQPPVAGQATRDQVFYFIEQDQLVASDHFQTAAAIAARFAGGAQDTLARLPAFDYTMKRSTEAAGGIRHHVRWFVEPFGYAEATRAASGKPRRRGQDMLKIIQSQGFPAIQGIGGHVFFATDGLELLHRTYVYAPPVRGAAQGEKYTLAMRMLDFPRSAAAADLDPQPWALNDAASYLTFNWRMKEAFKYSETLVDAIAGEPGVFDEIWLSMKTDPHGPKIDIYGGLVDHLGTRATILSDVSVPVTLKSERLMALVEVANPQAVAETIKKAFEHDPAARRRVFREHVIWEITPEQSLTDADATELSIEGAGFVAAAETEEVAQRPARGGGGGADPLPNMAITVFNGHLVVGTHVDFVEKLIAAGGPEGAGGGLDQTADFQRVAAELTRLGSGPDSIRMFSRTDESYRATYELLRQNKLPQSETMLARILNALTQQNGEGARRQQEIDGSKLPPFEAVQKYLGPAGIYIQQEDNGWQAIGCLLKK